MTHPDIATLFDRMDRWRNLPAYQLERRADIFFGLFLPEALDHHLRPRGITINPCLIPEFPLGQEDAKRSAKADYFALSNDHKSAFLIELKTDMKSLRDGQKRYLSNAVERGLAELLYHVKYIAKATRPSGRKKHFHLLQAIADLGLITLPEALEHKIYCSPRGVYKCIDDIVIAPDPPSLEVIYILPNAINDLDNIDFETFAGIVEHRGEIGRQFARHLQRWARIPAGSRSDDVIRRRSSAVPGM